MMAYFLLVLIVMFSNVVHADAPLQVSVAAQQAGKIKIVAVLIGALSTNEKMAAQLQKDLGFTQQYAISLHKAASVPARADIDAWYKQGYEMALFIQEAQDGKAFDWRLYDLADASMIKGKRCQKLGSSSSMWAHLVADAVWPELAQAPGFFSTKIAYCKDTGEEHVRAVKHIYVADYDGSNERLVVDTHTLNVAPRWNTDARCPMLFYSEHTNANVRLMMATMDKKRRVVVDFDGLSMLPSFSTDGKRVVFCASKGDGACDLYVFEDGKLERLTQNQGNNLAPVFTENNNFFFFCSDRAGAAQIYSYDFVTKKTERITPSGFCVSPAYCAETKKLAYSKSVGGVLQLFTYDVKTKKHTQLTFDGGNKEECSWSTCGNYLLFSVGRQCKTRIAMMQVHSGKRRYLTASNDSCSFPSWSPVYCQMPALA